MVGKAIFLPAGVDAKIARHSGSSHSQQRTNDFHSIVAAEKISYEANGVREPGKKDRTRIDLFPSARVLYWGHVFLVVGNGVQVGAVGE